jgi:hypothetical protein
MALTLAQKSDVRRHLKYPVMGNIMVSPGGGQFAQGFQGYRFFQAYGTLEWKMTNLAPDEEARLLGLAYGAVALVGPQPNPGDTISVTLSGGPIGSPQTITAVAGPAIPNTDMRLPLVLSLAAAINRNTVLQAAGVISLAPYGTGPYAMNAVPVPELSITAVSSFTIATAGSGILVPTITANGILLSPSTTLDGGNTTLWGFLPICNGLENAYFTTSDNLDTRKADVWTANPNEGGQRRSLYENQVQLMADFLGVPTFRQATQRPKRTGGITFA